MRTLEEVNAARARICEEIAKGGLSRDQLTLLNGVSVALCWVAGEHNSLSILMSGKQIVRDSNEAK